MTKKENNILLFSITLCWSASYLFIKSLPPDFSSFAYLTMTTGIAAIVLSAIFFKRLKKIKLCTVKRAFLLSTLLASNLLLEKKGIELLPSSSAGFLSAMTILFVPLLLMTIGVKPTTNNLVGAGLILLGLCFASRFLFSELISLGSLIMLLACFSSAVYIMAADKFAKNDDPMLVCILQMVFSSIFGFVMWLFEEPTTFFSINYTRELLSSIFILAFFTKAYAYAALMFAQKYATPISVTVIASTEPVVMLILAALIPVAYGGGDVINIFSLGGAVLIGCGAIVAQSKFLNKLKKEKKTD